MQERALQTQIAWACRILAMGGHTDLTLGHVSARGSEDQVYIKRKGLGLNEVTPDDILTIDLDRNKLAGDGKVHLEAVLHTEVYRLRPDVGAVAHTHPPYTTALSATSVKLEFVNHDAVLFRDGVGIFNKTADLILDAENGQAVARALGSRRAVLMCNHGMLVADKTVPWVVYAALTLERAARIQAIATSFGALQPIPQETVNRMYANKYRDEFIEEYWQYLLRETRRRGFAAGMPDGG
ncbi:MAG: class II aldolase/adducin family protein [Anaerolineales bacterium]